VSDSWRAGLLSTLYALPSQALQRITSASTLDEIYAQAQTAPRAQPGAPSTANSLGSASDSLVFTPMTPCRYIDTRNVGGALSAAPRAFNLVNGGTTYGGDIGCVLPSGSTPAFAANVTITVAGGAAGYVTLRPAGSTDVTSFINWPVGGTPGLANAGIIATAPAAGGGNGFEAVAAQNNPQLIVDLFGYFTASPPTPLTCVNTAVGTVHIAPGLGFANATACGAGYTIVSVSCDVSDSNVRYLGALPNVSTGAGYCRLFNAGAGTSGDIYVSSTCCRVP